MKVPVKVLLTIWFLGMARYLLATVKLQKIQTILKVLDLVTRFLSLTKVQMAYVIFVKNNFIIFSYVPNYSFIFISPLQISVLSGLYGIIHKLCHKILCFCRPPLFLLSHTRYLMYLCEARTSPLPSMCDIIYECSLSV